MLQTYQLANRSTNRVVTPVNEVCRDINTTPQPMIIIDKTIHLKQ